MNPVLVIVVIALAATYVAITILAGVFFTVLQQRVRKAWQPRLYRFLSKSDYDALVGGPAKTAEKALWWSSGLGVAAIVLMAIAIAYVEPQTPSGSEAKPLGPSSQVNGANPPLGNAGAPPALRESTSNAVEVTNDEPALNSLRGQ